MKIRKFPNEFPPTDSITNSLYSYIYLNAIAGLTALGDIFPDKIIPVLTTQIDQKQRKLELRLKIHEALLKIAQRCGETLPFHGIFLILLYFTRRRKY